MHLLAAVPSLYLLQLPSQTATRISGFKVFKESRSHPPTTDNFPLGPYTTSLGPNPQGLCAVAPSTSATAEGPR